MGSNPVWLAIRTIHSLQNYRDGLQSGLVAGRHNPVLKVLGDRLSSTGQAPKAVVVGAVMRKLALNGLGCLFTATILIIMILLKFDEGGWATVLMTGGLIAACYFVREHYAQVGRAVQQLEADILPQLYAAKAIEPVPRDPEAPSRQGPCPPVGLTALSCNP